MNLFNLILIVIISFITIDPVIIIANFTWDGLVLIKPENLTKTELVEKFKELSSSKSLKDLKDKNDKDKITIKEFLKSNYLRLSGFIFNFKSLITKITLFTILIKYFRKIRIIKFIFRIINYFFLSTFGIFISDIYGFKEIIAEIEYYWMKYVNFIHENKIYKSLIKIINLVIDIDETKSEVIKDNSKIDENKSESKIINSELPSSERELKNEKIVHDKTSGGDEKENWFELNKYFWIGLSVICLSLTYFYWDSIIGLIKNVDPEDGSTPPNSPDFINHEEEYKKYFKEKSTNEELYDLEVINDQNKQKGIEYIDVENTKWEDSPTTPKASSSKLPLSKPGVMLPISKGK